LPPAVGTSSAGAGECVSTVFSKQPLSGYCSQGLCTLSLVPQQSTCLVPGYQQRLSDLRILICRNPLAPDSVSAFFPLGTSANAILSINGGARRSMAQFDRALVYRAIVWCLFRQWCRVRGKSEDILLTANRNGTSGLASIVLSKYLVSRSRSSWESVV